MTALLLTSPVHADDWDIDIDDFDIGGVDSKGEEMVTYTGSTAYSAPEYKAGTSVSVTHTAGTISVRCVEREGISARVDYNMEGTNSDALKRFGDGIGLKVWGSSRGGGVQTRIPSASSSIKTKNVPLVVNLPVEARLRVNGGNGWIHVQGCRGTVATANRTGDILISGTLSTVSASAPGGSVTVEIDESSQLSGSSKITAGGGDAKVQIPSDYAGRIYAKGSSVQVRHLVDGTETDTLVQGTIGEGTASLTISARSEVHVQTSN